MGHFVLHVHQNPSYKVYVPYYCQWYGYTGYEITGLQKHINVKLSCENFYIENDVVTGLIPDLSTGEIVTNASIPHISAYNFERNSANGLLDRVQLNLIDNTLRKMNMDLYYEKKKASTSQI